MSIFSNVSNGIRDWAQGAFTIDPNTTPEQLARKRQMIQAMMPDGKAHYVGDRFEADKRAEASEQFNSILGGPLTMNGISPEWGQDGHPDQLDDLNEEFGTSFTQQDVDSRPELASFMQEREQPAPSFTPGDRDSFIQAMMPHAQRASMRTGIDPRLVIAQAAQETGWGRHAPNNNFFGIKSHGQSGGGSFATTEYVNGRPVTIRDQFRGYNSMGDSADGYAQFLLDNPRYRPMLAADSLDGQLSALGRSGYATDPNYASTVGSIARSIPLPGAAPLSQGASAHMSASNSPTMGYGGPSVQELQAAIMNPWLSASEKQVAGQLLAQAMQASDPMRQLQMQQAQLGLQKTQMEIDAMGQPAGVDYGFLQLDDGTFIRTGSDGSMQEMGDYGAPPEDDLPSSYRALVERARAAGLEPGTPEYQQFMVNGGADRGMRFTVGPDGSVEVVQGGAASSRPLSVDQAKSGGFLVRAQESNAILGQFDIQGADFWGRMKESVPGGNYMQTEEYQRFEQARRDFINAILRRESGAVIADSEFNNADKQYFPQPGDGAAVIEQKRRNREAAIAGLELGAGQSITSKQSEPPDVSSDQGRWVGPSATEISGMNAQQIQSVLGAYPDLSVMPLDVLDALIERATE